MLKACMDTVGESCTMIAVAGFVVADLHVMTKFLMVNFEARTNANAGQEACISVSWVWPRMIRPLLPANVNVDAKVTGGTWHGLLVLQDPWIVTV